MLAAVILLPAMLFAQFNNNTTSPYSRFGLGDLQQGAFGRSSAMAGAILGSRNNQHINLANPASYTSVDSLAFLFEFGFTSKFAGYKNDISSLSTNDVNFNYFAFSFPVANWLGIGMGLTPFSDSGYELRLDEEEENFGLVRHHYYGEGSLSRANIGIGLQPFKNISVGANLYYFFGSLTRNADLSFLEVADLYSVQKYELIRLRDFGFNYGVQATLPFKGNKQVTIGFTLENKPEFTAFHSDLTRKILGYGTSSSDIDTVKYINEEKALIKMPLYYGVGISYASNEKLEINADYIHQAWSEASFFGESNPFLTNLDRFAIGMELVPNKYSIRSYFEKIAYRAGFKVENSYLMLNAQQITDIGISFGVGLPVYRSLSLINLSAEFGKRGKTEYNLVREYYAKLSLSINLYDLWFIKRKYD